MLDVRNIPKVNKPIILPTSEIPQSFFFIARMPPSIGKIVSMHQITEHVFKIPTIRSIVRDGSNC